MLLCISTVTHHVDGDLSDFLVAVGLSESLDLLAVDGELFGEHMLQVGRVGRVAHRRGAGKQPLKEKRIFRLFDNFF